MRRPFLALLAALVACSRGDLRSAAPERRAAAVAALSSSRAEEDWPALLVAQDDQSPLVRKAAAGALTARAGPRAVEALGKLAGDPDPGVAVAAVRGLAALPQEARVRPLLVDAWAGAPAEVRVELAAALEAVGASPREAIEAEARRTWERNARALARGSGPERAGAAEELGRSGRTEAVKLLLPLLESDDPALAAAAARGLGHAGQREARAALEEQLDAADAAVAEAAARALGEIGDPAAAGALAELGRAGPERLAAAALDGLTALPAAPEVGVALCEIALRSQAPAVAARAARQVRLRDAECPDRPLLPRLSRGAPDLRAALAAAAELRVPPDRAQAVAERIVPLVSAAGLDPAVRAAASAALGRVGWGPAAPGLARRAAELRARLAQPPRRPAPGAAPPPAGGADADAAELAAAALAAVRLGAAGADELARALAADALPALRAAGAEALGALGGQALAGAVPLLADPSPAVRLAAARALGRPGSPAAGALEQAAARAGPGDAEWQATLARALGETGSAGAVPALGHLLGGPASAEAAAALARLGSADGARLLEGRLARREGRGRAEALEALASLAAAGAASAGPAVARDLWSDQPAIRAAAARAAGRLRYEPASPWLEALRGDYCGAVRRAAVEALARMPTGRRERR